MSEQEQLKKNAEEAYRKQRALELNKYLDALSARVSKELATAKRASMIQAGICVAWILTNFLHNEIVFAVGWLVFLSGLMYSHWCDRTLKGTFGEFHGALKTLYLLGLLDEDPDGMRGKRKKKRAWSDGMAMVKRWATEKKAAQDKVYSPA